MTKNGNGADQVDDPLAQAQTAYDAALQAVVSSVRILQMELVEVDEARRDLVRAGGRPVVDAAALTDGLKRQVAAWQLTNVGRDLLQLDPLLTHQQTVIANARADVATAEKQLQRVRAIEITSAEVEAARRARVAEAAENVIRLRKRLALLEGGGALGAFKTWLQGFGQDVRNMLQLVPVARPDLGALYDRERERAAREAERDDPLGALLARELG